MTESPRLDRQQRKSRAALQQALVMLVRSKPYADITIDDVVGCADVARGTFYAHYPDKDALLAAATQDLVDDLARDVVAASWVGAGTDWRFDCSGLLTLLDHVERDSGLYRLVISGEAGPQPRWAVIDTLHETAREVFMAATENGLVPRQPLGLTVTAYVGGLLAVVEDWIEAMHEPDAREIAAGFMQQHAPGLEWALGFEPGQLRFAGLSTAGPASVPPVLRVVETE
jgi:AcrR family transcriptional regulator